MIMRPTGQASSEKQSRETDACQNFVRDKSFEMPPNFVRDEA